MGLIGIGAILIVLGVVVATISTVRRGRMSQSETPVTHHERDTLEPMGQDKRLDLGADLPGIALAVLGGVLMIAGAVMGG